MTAFSNNCLIVTGGADREESMMKSCEIYDSDTNSWQKVADMNEGRSGHAAVQVKYGVLYIFGGMTDDTYTDSIERFTFATNIWEIINTEVKLPGRAWPGAV